jgi:Family of unknown function (DUF6027)
MTGGEEVPVVRLEPWTGSWEADDPNANFKADVALRSGADPLPALERLAAFVGLPLGAVCRYGLVRWVSAGAEALLELSPSWVRRLREPVERAEAAGTDAARLAAYHELADLVGWLAAGIDADHRP